MNYYPYHIGDFRSGTVNMNRQSRWIYRDMLDVYYDSEKPLTLDLDALCDEIGVESDDERRIVERLLRFKFVKSEDGYRHETCERIIAEYRAKAETAKANGKRGGRPSKPKATQSGSDEKPSGFQSGSDPVAIGNPDETGLKTNQEPITNNQNQSTSSLALTVVGATETDRDDDDFRGKPKMPPVVEPVQELSPAVRLTVALRELGVSVTSMHPTLLDWVAKGVTLQVATEAVVMARQYKPLPETIPPAYLNTIIQQILNPQAPTGKPLAPVANWWESASGIAAKGKELGLEQTEAIFAYYRDRVFAAAGNGPWNEKARSTTVRQGMQSVAALVPR
jgi:uncharacterized protein YdaU (DUF1376 family)